MAELSNSIDRFNGLVASLAIKAPCVAVAIANITLSGEQTINGVAVVNGDRVLVTAQTSSVDNGIYDVSSSAWARSADFDGNRDVISGTFVTVATASVGRNPYYQVTTANPITIGTTAIDFTLADGPNVSYALTDAEIAESLTDNDIIDSYEPKNILRYGAVDGLESTAAIQTTVNVAIQDSNSDAYGPAGDYIISSTITCGRLKIHGDGIGTRFLSTISDDSPVFDFPTATSFFSFQDFFVGSLLSQTDFLSGAINAQACTGIRIASSGGTFGTRYHAKNVLVRGCKVGYDIQGFIGSLENLWATNCETALIGDTMNSVRLNCRFENNRKDFAITASAGIHFDQYISEGGDLQSGLLTSTMDGCIGVVLTAPYFEQKRNVPFISFGLTTECKSIEVRGMTLASGVTTGSDYDSYPLAFDQVNGLQISGRFSSGNKHSSYSTTANTKNIFDFATYASVANWGPHDASGNLSPARNHFPNSNFDLWLRGYPVVTFSNCVIAQEATLVRRGKNAARMTLNAAAGSGTMNFIFNDGYLAGKLAGKTISLYMWVWIPNTSDYDPEDTTSQVVQPWIQIFTDGTGGTTTASGTHHTVRGAWNLFKISAAVPSDATRIDCAFVLDMFSGLSAGTEYAVVDSIFLMEGDLGQTQAIVNGWISDSDINPVKAVGGKMIMSGAAAPTDAELTHEVGDIVLNNAPVVDGNNMLLQGWECTVAGSPGTWVAQYVSTVSPAT